MNTNGINATGYSAYYVSGAENKVQYTKAKDESESTAQAAVREDVYVPSTEEERTEEAAYKEPKRLTAEQVEELKNQIYESMQSMVAKMLGQQAEKSDNMLSLSELADQLGLGKTPEEAAQAISEDGMWGVDAVSTRLMNMAVSLSGGDVSKAEELRAAVQKGFEEVEEMWGGELPQVCQDTYDETMKRFDYWVETGSMFGYGEA